MRPKACPELDTCFKIKMVLDHDLAGDWQYAEVIRSVCAKCEKQVALVTGMSDYSPLT